MQNLSKGGDNLTVDARCLTIGSDGLTVESDGLTVESEEAIALHPNAMSLPAPDYSESTIDHVVVRLARFGLISPEMQSWLASLPGAEHRPRAQEIALALARSSGDVSLVDLRNNLGLDSDECRSALADLIADGLLIGHADGPYALADLRRHEAATNARWEVLSHLDPHVELSIADLAERTGKSRNALRPILRELVDSGLIIATAPSQSRNRRYTLASNR